MLVNEFILEDIPFSGGKVKKIKLGFGPSWQTGQPTTAASQETGSTSRATSPAAKAGLKADPGLNEAMDHAWGLAITGITLEMTQLIHSQVWPQGKTSLRVSEELTSFGETILALEGDFEFNMKVPQQALNSVIRGNVLPPLFQASGYYLLQDTARSDDTLGSRIFHLVPQPLRTFAQQAFPRITDMIEGDNSPSRRQTVKR